jgi:hypothetical protein
MMDKEQKSSLRTEAIAGLTTFFTMAYIVVVNPAILSTEGTGMSFSGGLITHPGARKVFITGRSVVKYALKSNPEKTYQSGGKFLMNPLTLSIALSLLLCGANSQPEQLFSYSVAPAEIHQRIGNHSFAHQRAAYKTYSNARYGFSIAYPVGVLLPQGESDNGDGQRFVSRDGSATLLAFGSNRLDRSLRDEFQSAQENRTVTYKVIKADMFVVSGHANGKIFYQKTLLRGDAFKTFIIEYDEGERGTFDPITSRIARSFNG